jgi:glutamine synthetase
MSLAGPNFVLNTITADVLSEIADELEGCSADSLYARVQKLLQKLAIEHEKVVFNGDNYSAEWHAEAAKRGLPNLKDTVDALACLSIERNITVFKKFGVLGAAELNARQEILYEQYAAQVNIEALAALDIAKRELFPAAICFAGEVAAAAGAIEAAGIAPVSQKALLLKVNDLTTELSASIDCLEAAIDEGQSIEDAAAKAKCYRDVVMPAMASVRAAADSLEAIVDADIWPLPTYAEMLFMR